MSVVEVTPSQISEAELPISVGIRGQGLAQTVALSLDDDRRATLTEPTVALGETEVAVVDHSVPGELHVWVEDLAPGSYDLRIGSGGNQTVIRDAFRVLGDESTRAVSATGEVVSSNLATNNLDASDNNTRADVSREEAGVALSTRMPASSAQSSHTTASRSDSGSEASASPMSTDDASANFSALGVTDAATANTSDNTSPEGGACIDSTPLFADDFESGNFDQWTAYDTTGSCQTSGIASNNSVSGSQAFQGNITCSNSNGDHENYGGLQFNGDSVRGSYSDSGLGIDAPYGIVISFWARAQFDFAVDDGEWIAFLVLAGTCDWSDDVFSVGTGNATSSLAISHTAAGGGTPSNFAGAPTFPQDTWTKVTAYVNYHTSRFVVWQDGEPVTQASFVRPGTTLCHVRIGAYVSGDTNDARVVVDDPEIWKLNAELGSLETAPCQASN